MPDVFQCGDCGCYTEDDFCDSCQGEEELEACAQTPEHEASLQRPEAIELMRLTEHELL